MKRKTSKLSILFTRISTLAIKYTGSPYVFIGSVAILVIWAILGPIFNFSDTWQLVINTATSLITFLMVFLIQQSQNRDTMALHLKLNELIASDKGASNRLVDVEDLTEEELEVLKKFYVKLSKLSKKNSDLYSTHSIDEAEQRNAEKTEPKLKGQGKKPQ